jgi:hypothetical protein
VYLRVNVSPRWKTDCDSFVTVCTSKNGAVRKKPPGTLRTTTCDDSCCEQQCDYSLRLSARFMSRARFLASSHTSFESSLSHLSSTR